MQPIASDDVAAALAELTSAPPVNGTVEVAGPDACSLDTFAREYMAAKGDKRQLVADVHARYFGAELDDTSLTPGNDSHIGATSFDTWLRRSTLH